MDDVKLTSDEMLTVEAVANDIKRPAAITIERDDGSLVRIEIRHHPTGWWLGEVSRVFPYRKSS